MWAYLALAAAQLAGGYQQADLIKKSADVQASVNDMNAKYDELNAFRANAAGQSEAARYADIENATLGGQRTALAGANVDVGYGTAKDIQTDTKVTALVNTLELQKQGRDKAMGYNVQAINTRLGGQMAQLQGQMDAGAAQNRGLMSAASTAVSGYERMQSSGVGNQKLSGSNSTPTYSKPGARASEPSWFFGDNPAPYSQPAMGSMYGAQPDSTSGYKSLYDSGKSGDAESYFHSPYSFGN